MPIDHSKPYTLDRVVRIAITIGIFYGLILVMNYLSSVLVPFVVSLLIAYLIFPLVKWVQKRIWKNRIGATLLSLFVVTLITAGVIILTIPIIIKQIEKMGKLLTNLVNQNTQGNLPEYLQSVEEYILEFAQREEIRELLNFQNIEAVTEKVLPSLYGGLTGIFSGSLSVVLWLVGLTLIVFYIIFILIDYEEITEGWQELVPSSYRGTVVALLEDLRDGMETYFRAQTIIVIIVSILFAIGFTLVGLPMGILLGITIGLFNYVPYLQNVGFLPATFLTLMHSLETGDSFWTMMGLVLIVFFVVQTIQEAILTPKIMGDATGLNPAMILLSLTVWGKLLGMLGLLIALPVTSILISYYRRFLKRTEVEKSKSKLILEPHHIDKLIDEDEGDKNKDMDENEDDDASNIIVPS